jgi:hypothetical protein
MTLQSRAKQRAQDRRREVDALRPEVANRADRVSLIIEPSLRNFQPREMGPLSDFIVARLREYRLNAELETI